MFLNKLQKDNPRLIEAICRLHQSGELLPDSYVVDLEQFRANAAAILVVHYILATLLFTILSISYLEQWKWRRGLLIGFTSTFWIVLIFKYFFSVILP